jgi:hypothetical protein
VDSVRVSSLVRDARGALESDAAVAAERAREALELLRRHLRRRGSVPPVSG